MRTPIQIAVWACILVIFSPNRFLVFQHKKIKSLGIPAASNDDSVTVVSHAFWISLILVVVSGAVSTKGTFVQSVLESSLGVTGSRVTRIVEAKQLSEEVRSRHQIAQARPAGTSPLSSCLSTVKEFAR